MLALSFWISSLTNPWPQHYYVWAIFKGVVHTRKQTSLNEFYQLCQKRVIKYPNRITPEWVQKCNFTLNSHVCKLMHLLLDLNWCWMLHNHSTLEKQWFCLIYENPNLLTFMLMSRCKLDNSYIRRMLIG